MLPAQTLLFVCNVSNDAFTILTQQPIAGWHSQRFDSVTAALDAAPAFEEWLPFFFPEGACA